MKTIKKVKVTVEYVDTVPDHMIQDIIYVSYKYKSAMHLCLCGCHHKAVTPFNAKFGSNWTITIVDDKVTFTPSILNTNCPNNCHYVITDGIANILER